MLLLLQFLGASAIAAAIPIGSVVVSYEPQHFAITYPDQARPARVFSPDGDPIAKLDVGTGVAASSRHIYVLDGGITSYDLEPLVGGGLPRSVFLPPYGAVAVAVAGDGTVYSVTRDGVVHAFTDRGVLVKTFRLQHEMFDTSSLAVDGCTLWYLDSTLHVHRYDACADHVLPDPVLGIYGNFVRPIRGGFVVGAGNSIRVYDSSNLLRRALVVADVYYVRAIAFSSDGLYIWAAGPTSSNQNLLQRIEISTGATKRFASVDAITGLAVVGETLPTVESLMITVPTLSVSSCVLLFIGLVACALLRVG